MRSWCLCCGRTRGDMYNLPEPSPSSSAQPSAIFAERGNKHRPTNLECNSPDRLYAIDVLRGFAAFAVVLYHWQHFGIADGNSSDRSGWPFYSILSIAYEHGHFAVQLFFVISGFIFFWMYGPSIHARSVNSFDFFIARFSRLYPLHIITIFMVLFLQNIHINTNGYYFVYIHNDGFHLILNLLFVDGWGFGKGFSFNGPSWSVSIEIFLYIIFFYFAKSAISVKRTILFSSISIIFMLFFYKMGGALMCFFLGGLAYLITKLINNIGIQAILFSILSIMMVNYIIFLMNPVAPLLVYVSENFPPLRSKLDAASNGLILLWVVLMIFLPTIIAIAAIEMKRGPTGKQFAWVGDISYSTYLLHFPLQLLFILLLGGWNTGVDIVTSPLALILFLTLLIAAGMASYHWFERPLQRRIRHATLPKAAP